MSPPAAEARQLRVYVGPASCPPVERAVARSGAQLTPAAEAEVFIWFGTPDELSRAIHPGVKWVQLKAAGIDRWIQSGVIDARIAFTSARGVYGPIVAEHALALLLVGARRLHERARANSWSPGASGTLDGARVVIVGCGGIGEALLRLISPLGAVVTAVTRSGRRVEGAAESLPVADLGTALDNAQYLVLAAPSTGATRHLIGARELQSMPDEAWIVNVARGDLIDTDALADAVDRSEVRGAALDVTEPEPLPSGHRLWRSPRVLITPHEANPPAARWERLAGHVEENLARYRRREELLSKVDLSLGY